MARARSLARSLPLAEFFGILDDRAPLAAVRGRARARARGRFSDLRRGKISVEQKGNERWQRERGKADRERDRGATRANFKAKEAARARAPRTLCLGKDARRPGRPARSLRSLPRRETLGDTLSAAELPHCGYTVGTCSARITITFTRSRSRVPKSCRTNGHRNRWVQWLCSG